MNTLLSLLKRLRPGASDASSTPDPLRHWFVLLTLSGLILASIIVWNAWAFDTVASGGVIGDTATTTPAAFDPAAIDTLHAIIQSRAAEEEKYMTGIYRYADPSQ